jgi:ABC-type hemin transport system ATPase subunit
MDDQKILEQINKLAAEEHALWKKESAEGVSGGERERLQKLEQTLDQCWDLLHQRRARRGAGQDPSTASVRDPSTVEGYQG